VDVITNWLYQLSGSPQERTILLALGMLLILPFALRQASASRTPRARRTERAKIRKVIGFVGAAAAVMVVGMLFLEYRRTGTLSASAFVVAGVVIACGALIALLVALLEYIAKRHGTWE
jgi:hypothetical protein